MDITVIGAAIVDVLAAPFRADGFYAPSGACIDSQSMEQIILSFGGDALNEAVALSRLGKQVELVSTLGQDEAGTQVLHYLQENGVDTSRIAQHMELDTGVNVVLIDENGERRFLTNPHGSLRRLTEEDILPHLDTAADIVSFASMFVSPLLDIPAMKRLFARIKAKPGRVLAVDLTKAKQGETLSDLQELLPYIDYLFPNEEEAALLTGDPDPECNAALFLEAGVGCVAMKCGQHGCLIHSANHWVHLPAYPVEQVVDTTGAGDCFAAGFLWALSEGGDLTECGRFATAVASCSVEQVGALTGLTSPVLPMQRYRELHADAEW